MPLVDSWIWMKAELQAPPILLWLIATMLEEEGEEEEEEREREGGREGGWERGLRKRKRK